ncbi:MFS domain-containing protein [Favolaschia claudopus]|uniref:MFS domain-containing protein n=1 Tax=Favolaschia claudopus TaxID=2862362 RepID=A0AAW0BF64_9AGAR
MNPPHLDSQSLDESTPLLEDHVDLEAAKRKTPLPRALTALCVARFSDPISYSQLFPYINKMLYDLRVTDDMARIGFYSGLVESIFAVSQTLTTYTWARASDSVGRRPIILICAVGLAIATLLLGFCTSLADIIFVRALAGFFAGNVAVYHAVLAEITDSSNSPRAYSLYAFIWPLGSTIGPLIGGSFSNLGTKFPQLWGYDFILAHPYFMPNFVCALCVVVGLCLSYFYLEETLPAKRRGSSINMGVTCQAPRLGALDLLSIPMLRALTMSSFTLAFTATAFDVVFVLFCYTPIEQGGLSFSVTEIGNALSLNGLLLAVFQLFIMPSLLRKYRSSSLYHTCTQCWPLTFALMPLLNLVVRRGYDDDNETVELTTNLTLWIGIVLILSCSRIASAAFTTNMILIRDNAPNPSYIGACSGLMQMIMCVSRMFSPAFISSVFALSVGNNLLWGYPIWVVVMLGSCCIGCYISHKIKIMDQQA